MTTTCSYVSCRDLNISSCYNEKNFRFIKRKTTHRQGFLFVSSCSKEAENTEDSADNEGVSRTLVVERYNNETTKRYVLDRHSMLHIVDDVHEEIIADDRNGFRVAMQPPHLPSIVKEFVLPAGFPGSVSDDYLEYMLWQFPTSVTAWICRTLVTSSLLKAVGVGSWSGSTAAAAAAAIKWVSKDGFGAVGRLFIGGRFGGLFDDDPKQWRMYADFVGSAGSIFELVTPLVPGYFLPLASLGNLTKAVAKGLKDPSFRVIQNHFAVSGNLGDVAAKEEVWEVAGQLVGLALGVGILATPGLLTSYPLLALSWASLRLLHLWLRYQSLAVLRFSTINLKRARILVESHISGSPIPGCDDCNQEENILIFQEFLKPCIRFGCSLQMLIGTERSGHQLENLLDLYRKEKYILVINANPLHGQEIRVAFKVGATGITVLRSIWQAYWLYVNGKLSNNRHQLDQSSLLLQDKSMDNSRCLVDLLMESLLKLNETFDDFLHQVENAGWDIKKVALKVPKKVIIVENETEETSHS
eukprot:Gb_18644 [translate_table: standard]